MLVSNVYPLLLQYNGGERFHRIYPFADRQEDCMEIVISHCEKLSKIDENAFVHLDICNVSMKHFIHKALYIQ